MSGCQPTLAVVSERHLYRVVAEPSEATQLCVCISWVWGTFTLY